MALPARLFCDTSFFYACFDQHDVNHELAKQLSEEAATVGLRKICSASVRLPVIYDPHMRLHFSKKG